MTIIKAEIQHLNDLIPLFDSYHSIGKEAT